MEYLLEESQNEYWLKNKTRGNVAETLEKYLDEYFFNYFERNSLSNLRGTPGGIRGGIDEGTPGEFCKEMW